MKSKWKQQKIIHDYKLMYLTIYLKKKGKTNAKNLYKLNLLSQKSKNEIQIDKQQKKTNQKTHKKMNVINKIAHVKYCK